MRRQFAHNVGRNGRGGERRWGHGHLGWCVPVCACMRAHARGRMDGWREGGREGEREGWVGA